MAMPLTNRLSHCLNELAYLRLLRVRESGSVLRSTHPGAFASKGHDILVARPNRSFSKIGARLEMRAERPKSQLTSIMERRWSDVSLSHAASGSSYECDLHREDRARLIGRVRQDNGRAASRDAALRMFEALARIDRLSTACWFFDLVTFKLG